METGIIVMVVMMVGMMFGMGWMHGKHKKPPQKESHAQVEVIKSTNTAVPNLKESEHQH